MKAIVAVDNNWAIGKDNSIPWHIPEDMNFFKETTKNSVVIMGRKTLESLPKKQPLKDRINIVISRDYSFTKPGALVVHTIEEAIFDSKNYKKDVYVIGGEKIYQSTLKYCDTVYVTKVNNAFDADKYFPNLDLSNEWKLTHSGEIKTYSDLEYCFCEYNRIRW